MFDYEETNSENSNWHRAKKIREIHSVNKSTSTLLLVLKNRVFWPPVKNKNKTNLEPLKAEKFFEIMHEKSHFFLFFINISNK